MNRIGCAASDAIQPADSRLMTVRTLGPDRNVARRMPLELVDEILIGKSPSMHSLKKSIRIVAHSKETVLITGESGTGKELIAHAIHDLGPRRNKPFLPVNCGALTESLLESELFGHMKGSFTGATSRKKGFFEAATGGTLFLDEFAEMSLAVQQRLLRVLQEGTVRPVGSTEPKEIEIDSRVLVATNHDLKRDVLEGRFRNDLYYRVNVLEIRAPALRERRQDILPLAQHFIRRYNQKNACAISDHLSSGVLEILEAYSWPGNVRELENITKRLAIMVGEEGIFTEADVQSVPELRQETRSRLHCAEPTEDHQFSAFDAPNARVREACQCPCSEELNLYRRCMNRAGGNVAEVARQLNIPRKTLSRRMKKLASRCASKANRA